MKKIKALLKWNYTRQFLALLLGLCLLAGCMPALADDPPAVTVTAVPDPENASLADITVTVDGDIDGDHPAGVANGIFIDTDGYAVIDGADASRIVSDTETARDSVNSQAIGDVTINADSISETIGGTIASNTVSTARGVQLASDSREMEVNLSGGINAETISSGVAYAYGIDATANDADGVIRVTTEGDVSANAEGKEKASGTAAGVRTVYNTGSTTVDVGGNVSAFADSETYYTQSIGLDVLAYDNGEATITVDGSVSAVAGGNDATAAGIWTEADGNAAVVITVLGDVSASNEVDSNDNAAVGLRVTNNDQATTDIIIDGTLSGEDVAIVINPGNSGASPENITLTAWAVAENADGHLAESLAPGNGQTEAQVAEAFEARINYIVKIAEAYGKNLGASTGTAVTAGDNTYATAVADEDVALSLQLGEDEVLEGVYYNSDDTSTLTETANLQKNTAGSYVMKMLRGGGMLLGLKTHTHIRDTKKENVNDATCKEAGSYDEVIYCTVCKNELGRVKKTIPVTDDHTPGNAVHENTVNATCRDAGSYEEVVYCTVCGKELSREKKTIPVT
ncbi:MAG: hypothetical protein IJK06_03675, partial [Clostridia bacterium]|nr:hypothetical protein [Clostridia bacterium]